MRRAAEALLGLALAGWVGGGALYTFVLAPAIFRSYGRDRAAEIIGTLMPLYFGFVLAGVALAGALLLLLLRGASRRVQGVALGLALSAVVVQGYVTLGLYPRIVAVKATVASFEADPDAPPRRLFRRLHGVSMALNLLVLLEGAALLVLAPRAAHRAGGATADAAGREDER